ncbi:unnamed protein product, partial [Allacma fusca]
SLEEVKIRRHRYLTNLETSNVESESPVQSTRGPAVFQFHVVTTDGNYFEIVPPSGITNDSSHLATIKLQKLMLTKLEMLSRKLDDLTFEASSLTLVGGRSLKDATANIVTEIMSDGLAMGYKWAGTKRGETHKLSFKKLKLELVVYDAIRKMRYHSTAQNSDIKGHIQYWLKHSKGRKEAAEYEALQ